MMPALDDSPDSSPRSLRSPAPPSPSKERRPPQPPSPPLFVDTWKEPIPGKIHFSRTVAEPKSDR